MDASYSLGSLLSVDNVLECASALSKYRVNTVWVPETWGMECFSMMSAVSQRASSSQIGSSIINIYSRSPALVAMGAVTVDSLSGGKAILGLGASSQPIVESLHGLEYDAPLARMREYVDIIRLACSGQRIEYTGNIYSLSGFKILIKPPRKRIPIYLAGVGPRMLDLASEIADGVILYLRPLGELGDTVRHLRARSSSLDVACQIITAVSDDADAAIERAKKTISFYVAVSSVYRDFLAGHGYASVTLAIADEYTKTGNPQNPSFVPDSMADELAICGTPESCKKALRRFKDAGVTHPILQFNPVGSVAESFALTCSTFSEVQ